jgi:lipopolysaccharide transport system ATP-binding protein
VVVDEVLAVGDVAFREQCLGKISEIGGHGRTVLYVSHDLGSVTRLCSRAIWLHEGRIRADGQAADVVASYLAGEDAAPLTIELPPRDEGAVRLDSVAVRDPEGKILSRPRRDQPLLVDLRLQIRERVPGLDASVWVVDGTGMRVIDDNWSDTHPDTGLGDEPGGYSLAVTIPPVLRPGRYTLGVWLGTQFEDFAYRDLFSVQIMPLAEDRAEMIERPRLVQSILGWRVRREPGKGS